MNETFKVGDLVAPHSREGDCWRQAIIKLVVKEADREPKYKLYLLYCNDDKCHWRGACCLETEGIVARRLVQIKEKR